MSKVWFAGTGRLFLVTFLLAFFGQSPSAGEAHVVTVKSFIRTIDLDGETDGVADWVNAAAINADVGENPSSSAKAAKDFRLYSSVSINLTCQSNKVTEWSVRQIETAVGSEGFGFLNAEEQAPTLSVQPSQNSPHNASVIPQDKISYSYKYLGRPNSAARIAMNAVQSRSCSWIWHKVSVDIGCAGDTPTFAVELAGSGFPSHRVWVDNQKTEEVDQGKLAKLWECDGELVK